MVRAEPDVMCRRDAKRSEGERERGRRMDAESEDSHVKYKDTTGQWSAQWYDDTRNEIGEEKEAVSDVELVHRRRREVRSSKNSPGAADGMHG